MSTLPGPKAPLPLRQLAVLRLVAAGASTRDIARRLGVSEATVQRLVRAMCAALGARNRCHAVYLAMRDGYLR